jgi:hypothetical protein
MMDEGKSGLQSIYPAKRSAPAAGCRIRTARPTLVRLDAAGLKPVTICMLPATPSLPMAATNAVSAVASGGCT